MNNDIKKLARQQYFKYFKIWFWVLGILIIISIVSLVIRLMNKDDTAERANDKSPSERVYDGADVLSDREEKELRELIEEAEEQIQCDIIIVTINQPVEYLDDEERDKYGYRYDDWEGNMQDIADDFYDNNKFGYNEAGSDGDGILFLDNWYPEQVGSWISGSGRAAEVVADQEWMILDAFEAKLDQGEYEAYVAAVKKIAQMIQRSEEGIVVYGEGNMYIWGVIFIPIIVAAVFIVVNIQSKEGKSTTNVTTYVANGRPRVNVSQDNFLRKSVTSRVIQTSSSSGGTRSGGGGSMHTSRGGYSHSGGGRRR